MFKGNTSLGGTGSVTVHFSISNVKRIEGSTITLSSDNADVWCDYFKKIGLSPICNPAAVTLPALNTSIVLYEVNVE